jgi:hypothetical protein
MTITRKRHCGALAVLTAADPGEVRMQRSGRSGAADRTDHHYCDLLERITRRQPHGPVAEQLFAVDAYLGSGRAPVPSRVG